MVVLITIATFFSTLVGGLFALRLKDKLHLVLGFSAGAVIAVAFFDLLPEAFSLTSGVYATDTVLSLVVVGFATYLVLDRLILMHGHDEESRVRERGDVGALSLSFHSLLDGVSIGLAFHVSTAVGVIVAAAVLTHDFSDGINTVNLVVKNGGDRARALRWLLVDALAPVVGVVITFFFALSENALGTLLALFCGFFLYIGASDLIPESSHAHEQGLTTVMTVLGILVLYGAIRLAGV